MIVDKIHIHKTRDGTKIPIHRIKTNHLNNIIRLAKKHMDNVNKDVIDIYLNESDVRNIYPSELIMNETNRFKSINPTKWNCQKKDCKGRIKEYESKLEKQVFCDTCWVQHGPIEVYTLYGGERLSSIIELHEFGHLEPAFPYWWKY